MSELEQRLERHLPELTRIVARAGALLAFENEEDLRQGILLRALERGEGYRDEGEEPFRAWLKSVARSYLADRANYWKALRRRPAGLLRLTAHGLDPAAEATGPATHASRKEQVRLALRALATLLPRDRDLVQWSSEEVPLEEQAQRLGIGYDAAKQARLRALDRFRKAYHLATRRK